MDKMNFVDTNIFLEIILDDKKSEQCKSFLTKVKNNNIKALTTDFIIYSCLLQIQHKIKSQEKMKQFLSFINELKGLKIIRPSLNEMYKACIISKKYNLDFDDSLVVAAMIDNNCKYLVSLDGHFDKISIIKRIEPN
jgi:predicted nucleic acid-binding protein